MCQAVKYETTHPTGLLKPLPILQQPWTDISMDFKEGLPKSKGQDVILVALDHLTKFGHLIPLSHPYTNSRVAELFMTNVFKLYGLPKSIRDPAFLSSFWKTPFTIQGFSLDYSSAYYPQSDGQTEALNKCLETYLRFYTGEKPSLWVQ